MCTFRQTQDPRSLSVWMLVLPFIYVWIDSMPSESTWELLEEHQGALSSLKNWNNGPSFWICRNIKQLVVSSSSQLQSSSCMEFEAIEQQMLWFLCLTVNQKSRHQNGILVSSMRWHSSNSTRILSACAASKRPCLTLWQPLKFYPSVFQDKDAVNFGDSTERQRKYFAQIFPPANNCEEPISPKWTFENVGGGQETMRELTQTQGEHANYVPRKESNM